MAETKFLEWLEEKKRSPRTIKEYAYYLSKLNELGEFNQENVDTLLRKFNNRVCRATVSNYKKFILRNKVDTDLTPEQIRLVEAIDIPEGTNTDKKRKPEVISFEQVGLIMNKLPKQQYKIMLLLTYRCALRISELFSISKSSFNFHEWLVDRNKNGILTVIGKGNKKDTILVKPHVMQKVLNFINTCYDSKTFDPKVPLFCSITPDHWRRVLSRASTKAIGRHINPHMLRHSYATYLLENGWDIRRIQVFLRHEDISSTQIYAQVSKKQLSEDYENID